MLQETYVSDISKIRRDDSSKCKKKYMFYEEIRTKQNLSYMLFYSKRILYNSKYILMVTTLEISAVFVTRVHCIRTYMPVQTEYV